MAFSVVLLSKYASGFNVNEGSLNRIVFGGDDATVACKLAHNITDAAIKDPIISSLKMYHFPPKSV